MRVLSIGPGVLDQNDNVYITTAVLPGYSIANQAVPFMGLSFNIPGGGMFPGSDAWNVMFRCDAQLNIREKLIGWQKSIFNSFPNDASNSVGAYAPKGDDTVALVAILNRDGSIARAVKLIGIWPQNVGEIAYDTTLNGNVVTCQATLAYQWWQPEFINDRILGV
ncbi:MAG: hypothetical protein PHS54_00575 [Clostridia bacterium]|nr:hypothetical protein [Clostridia bacterium]